MRKTELVQVFATADLVEYLFVKSLFERDSVEHLVKGDTSGIAQGTGAAGWTEFPVQPVEFWVRSQDVVRAQLLLRDLDSEGQAQDSSSDA